MFEAPHHPQNALVNPSGATLSLADEQMHSLYKSLPFSLIASLIIAIILSASHWKVVGQGEIIFWNLLLGSSLLARLVLWIFWNNTRQLYPVRFWLIIFRIGAWLTGAAWGASAVLLFAHDNTIYQALLAFSLAGVASGSITSLTVDKYSSLGFVILAISPLSLRIFLDNGPTALAMSSMTLLFIFFVLASSARARRNLEEQLNKNLRLLILSTELNHKQTIEKIINHSQSIFIHEQDTKAALQHLLRETLLLTQSALGFIGKVEKDETQKPFMKAVTFASAKDNKAMDYFRDRNLPENGEFHNLNNFFGVIMEEGKPLISPNYARDMRSGGLPEGHPAINNFIGIPIFNGPEQIAILGLANSPAGYNTSSVDFLTSILQTIGQFIQTINHEQQHAHDRAALEANTERTQTILNDIADGIISINQHGIIQSLNHAGETIFGYKAKQIIGKNISQLMAEPHKSLHSQYLNDHLKSGKKNILGVAREVTGLRRNGSEFPMDLMVSRVFQNKEPVFIGIVRDITEKKRIDDLRNQFIATANREIRTPLNTLTEAITLLKSGEHGQLPESLSHLADIAQQNSLKLQKLMNDLVEAQHLSKGNAFFKLDNLPVMPLVEECVQRNKAYADIYLCNIVLLNQARQLIIHIDPYRFDQALSHLLQHTIKYAKPGSDIKVSVSEHQSRVKISISDKNVTATDTKPLARVMPATEPYNGNDLSLGIMKDIVEKMNGIMNSETHPGDRRSFYLEFPLVVKTLHDGG